jgi:four helix bundle protein
MVNRAHKKLDVWQERVALATHIYQITEKFPKSEIYGLTSQMRRAVVSISSNIAEVRQGLRLRNLLSFLT